MAHVKAKAYVTPIPFPKQKRSEDENVYAITIRNGMVIHERRSNKNNQHGRVNEK